MEGNPKDIKLTHDQIIEIHDSLSIKKSKCTIKSYLLFSIEFLIFFFISLFFFFFFFFVIIFNFYLILILIFNFLFFILDFSSSSFLFFIFYLFLFILIILIFLIFVLVCDLDNSVDGRGILDLIAFHLSAAVMDDDVS